MLLKKIKKNSKNISSAKNDNSDIFSNDNSHTNRETECEIPVGYRLLPGEFFKEDTIKPPLILINWLSSLNFTSLEKENFRSEDSVPLEKCKIDVKKKRKKRCKVTKKSNRIKELFVCRKRGRPRKEVIKSISRSEGGTNLTDNFWNLDTLNDSLTEHIPSDDEGNESLDAVLESNSSLEPVKEVVDKKKGERVKFKGNQNDAVQGVDETKANFPCGECGKSFSAASTLKNHTRIHNNTLLKCTDCQKGFTTKYLLKCHMRIHNGDLFMCHKCGKGFITAELLKVHSRGHTGDRPFVCNICSKSFPSASNLSQHKQTHNSDKKFLCFQCGSSFSQKRCLDGHMLTHAEKSHICTVCKKLWARKSDLNEHMRVHTGIKPYTCKVCLQKFTQASSLKRHQVVHTDVNPVQCSVCFKSFKCYQYYKRHKRRHGKERDHLIESTIKEV